MAAQILVQASLPCQRTIKMHNNHLKLYSPSKKLSELFESESV